MEKGIYKGICFFDKGGMDGWGATWKKTVVFLHEIGVFEKPATFLENTEQKYFA